MVSISVSMASHVESTQNNKFVTLCNISRKKGGMKLILCTGKHQCFLHVDNIIFDAYGQASLEHLRDIAYNIVAISPERSEC